MQEENKEEGKIAKKSYKEKVKSLTYSGEKATLIHSASTRLADKVEEKLVKKLGTTGYTILNYGLMVLFIIILIYFTIKIFT